MLHAHPDSSDPVTATVSPATRRVFSPTRLAFVLLVPACVTGAAQTAPTTVRVAARTDVATPYTHDARAVLVSSTDLSPPPVSGVSACRVRMHTTFHLRPVPVPMSVGPEIAADTEVEVVAMSHLLRSVHGGEQSYNEVFARIRLVNQSTVGYAFIRRVDLSERCRIMPEREEELPPLEERLASARHRRFAARGFFRLPNQPLRGGFQPGHDQVVARLDADGDGTRDAVLLLRTQGRDGAFVLRRQTAQGWAAADLTERWDHDHFSQEYNGALRIEGELFFHVGGCAMGGMTRSGCGRVALNDDVDRSTLLRLHPSGELIPVLQGAWRVDEEGFVRVAGVRHHWDASQFAFVPEEVMAPGLPWFEPDGDRCPSLW